VIKSLSIDCSRVTAHSKVKAKLTTQFIYKNWEKLYRRLGTCIQHVIRSRTRSWMHADKNANKNLKEHRPVSELLTSAMHQQMRRKPEPCRPTKRQRNSREVAAEKQCVGGGIHIKGFRRTTQGRQKRTLKTKQGHDTSIRSRTLGRTLHDARDDRDRPIQQRRRRRAKRHDSNLD
jgi:hypothetical protein